MRFTLVNLAIVFASFFAGTPLANGQVNKRDLRLLPAGTRSVGSGAITGSLLGGDNQAVSAKVNRGSLKRKRNVLELKKLLADLPLVNSHSKAVQAQGIREQQQPVNGAKSQQVHPQSSLVGQLVGIDILDSLGSTTKSN